MAEKKEPTATTSAVSGAKTQDADNTEGGHGVPKMTKKQLRSHIKQLQKVAATSTDPSLTAQVIALSNKKARKLFLEKINDDDFLSKGIECVDRGTSTETKYVLFKFECKPGTLSGPALVRRGRQHDRSILRYHREPVHLAVH